MLEKTKFSYEFISKVLVIKDELGIVSVTNAFEEVLDFIQLREHTKLAGKAIVYRDSCNSWGSVDYDGKTVSFKKHNLFILPLPVLEYMEIIKETKKVVALTEYEEYLKPEIREIAKRLIGQTGYTIDPHVDKKTLFPCLLDDKTIEIMKKHVTIDEWERKCGLEFANMFLVFEK